MPTVLLTDRSLLETALRGAVGALVTDQCCAHCSLGAVPPGAASWAFYHENDLRHAFAPPGFGHPQADCPDPACPCREVEPDGLSTLAGELYVGFGAPDPWDVPLVGRRVAAALRQAGFAVRWAGDPGVRVLVTGLRGH